MASTENTGLGHGTNNYPQIHFEENIYQEKVKINENNIKEEAPKYKPIEKHKVGKGNISVNPIKSNEEGQHLLDTGFKYGKQIYNITKDGDIVKFQPDNTQENGYHAYKVSSNRDIPPQVIKALLMSGKISKSQYNKIRKGKGD